MTRMFALALVSLVACSKSPSSGDQADASGSGSGSGSGSDGSVLSSTTPVVPQPTGTCPTITSGDVTFAPAGIPARKVLLTFTDAAMAGTGPLIFYWHATGSAPQEAAYSLGDTMGTINAAGGIVAAPYPDPTAGEFEWFIVNQSPKLDDFLVEDEVVACLAQAHMIDTTHIHSMGMSAGALQTTAVSFMRAAYIASVATYSGGIPPNFTPANENPANLFAALIFDGGSTDDVFGVDFQAASMLYDTTLTAANHYAELCDHGGGHNIPLDAAPSVAMFFAANGFGAWPSPYASGIPASFPSYCAR